MIVLVYGERKSEFESPSPADYFVSRATMSCLLVDYCIIGAVQGSLFYYGRKYTAYKASLHHTYIPHHTILHVTLGFLHTKSYTLFESKIPILSL